MKEKIIIIFVIVVALLLMIFLSESVTNYRDECFMKKWYDRFHENLTPIELSKKYPDIRVKNLIKEPHTEWCYIYEEDLLYFIFSSNRSKVIYKDAHGKVLAFWKGKKISSSTYKMFPEHAQYGKNQNDAGDIYEYLKAEMKYNGFKPYPPETEGQ